MNAAIGNCDSRLVKFVERSECKCRSLKYTFLCIILIINRKFILLPTEGGALFKLVSDIKKSLHRGAILQLSSHLISRELLTELQVGSAIIDIFKQRKINYYVINTVISYFKNRYASLCIGHAVDSRGYWSVWRPTGICTRTTHTLTETFCTLAYTVL